MYVYVSARQPYLALTYLHCSNPSICSSIDNVTRLETNKTENPFISDVAWSRWNSVRDSFRHCDVLYYSHGYNPFGCKPLISEREKDMHGYIWTPSVHTQSCMNYDLLFYGENRAVKQATLCKSQHSCIYIDLKYRRLVCVDNL